MNWIERLEEKRGLLITGIVLVCVAMFAVTARRNPVSYDIYWHIQIGLDWLRHGLNPFVDHYSFSFAEESVKGVPIPFEVVVAWLVDKFGLVTGLEIFKFSSYVVLTSLFAWHMKRSKSPVAVWMLVLPFLVMFIQFRTLARPELFSYGLSVIAVMLYDRANRKISMGTMLPIIVLMLLWTNYHSSILGYVIFFGLFIDSGWRQLTDRSDGRQWLYWFLWGVAVVIVGFANPAHSHAIIDTLTFAPEWRGLIQEYTSAASLYSTSLQAHIALLMVLATLVLAAWNRRPGYVFVIIFLAYQAITTARLIAPVGIITLAIFISLIRLSTQKKPFQNKGEKSALLVAIAFSLVFVLVVGSTISSSRAFMQQNVSLQGFMPDAMISYMRSKNLNGRIFNEYGLGGFLAYSLYPESSIYIDGRTNILYPIEHFQRYEQAKNNPKIFMEEVNKYDIDLVILNDHPFIYSVMKNTGQFELDFVDVRYSLFVKSNASFPETGKLLAYPACWTDSDMLKIETEQQSAIFDLPFNSLLLPYLEFVVSYSNTEDRSQFLTDFDVSESTNTHVLKFAAYQALSLGLNEKAIEFLTGFNTWELSEFIAASIAYSNMNDWKNAESILNEGTKIAWPNLTDGQTALLYQSLNYIRTHSELTSFDDEYLEKLLLAIANSGISIDESSVDLQLFCSD